MVHIEVYDRRSRYGRRVDARRAGGYTAAGTLAAIGVLHAQWAANGTWPFEDRLTLSRTVANTEDPPPPGLTFLVAVLLWLAALTLLGRLGRWGRWLPTWCFRWTAVVLAGVMLIRGGAGLVTSLAARPKTRYHRLDIAVYSPLCLALGLAAGLLAVEPSRAPR